MDDLRRLVPMVGLGDPLMILVETDAVPATITRLDAKLDDIDYRGGRGRRLTDDWAEMQRQEDALVDSHIASLARLARRGLCDSQTSRQRRAAQAKGVLSAAELQQLTHGEPPAELPAELLDRGAAVYAEAEPLSDERTAALAGVVKTRLGKQRVPGSHWARSMGCGTHIEGHPEIGRGIMCGMGHVPEKCSRFLYFYTVPTGSDKDSGTIL
jgi:hypothetical protein